MNLRVAAIAKDEAPYIAQWVFHHLYFGFSSIDIVVNKTTDRTCEILHKISLQYPVNFADIGSGWIGPENLSFQRAAYTELLCTADRYNINRLLFIDIDEFWTPKDFKTTIENYLKGLSRPEIISFEWALLRSDFRLFGLGFQSSNQLCKNNHLKTLFDPKLTISKLSVHNVECAGVPNVLGDGSPNPRPYKDRLMEPNIHATPLRRAFILHRYWRSPLEYVASLGQGLAQDRFCGEGGFSTLKLNRNGFSGGGIPTAFEINSKKLRAYQAAYSEFLERCGIADLVDLAKKELLAQVPSVIAQLRQYADIDPDAVSRVLSGLNQEAFLLNGKVEPMNANARRLMALDHRVGGYSCEA